MSNQNKSKILFPTNNLKINHLSKTGQFLDKKTTTID